MRFQETLATIVAVVAFTSPAVAYTKCLYEQYQCGYDLVETNGYNLTQLEEAANATASIPQLEGSQLLNTLFRCININGDIVGNSYCIAGCIGMASLTNDQCAM